MIENSEDPHSSNDPSTSINGMTDHAKNTNRKTGLGASILRKIFRNKLENGHDSLREAIEVAIEQNAQDFDDSEPGSERERLLITNILNLRNLTALDVMIPRADIAAIDAESSTDELMKIFAEKQNTRIPVYQGSLDNLIGTVHIKDFVAKMAEAKTFHIKDIIRDVPIVSPAMSALDLLLFFQKNKRHMAMVVDEYGGIDGLATIGDVIEAIVGEIEDEYQIDNDPIMTERNDGTIIADARTYVEDFENKYGEILEEDEREDIDTLAGLVFSIAGRVPGRGEVIVHDNGTEFEVLDADPRRINRLKIRNIQNVSD